MNKHIEKYIDTLNTCMDIATFKNTLLQLSRAYGFEYAIYNIQITNPFDVTKYFAIGNYPTAWIQTYESRNYASLDPIIQHCTYHEEAIIWHESYSKTSSPKIINFFDHAKSFNLQDGISKGLRVNDKERGILSLATNKKLSYEDTQKALESINHLQTYIHKTMMRVSKDSFNIHTPILTKREDEILFHLAIGETSAKAAKALGISEATVVFHMKNIIQKLDANNRTHAIVKAVSLNLINLDDFKNSENQYSW